MYPVCHDHAHLVTLADTDDGYDSVLDQFLQDIHSGKVEPGMIHAGYYSYIARRLSDAVAIGLGGTAFGADDYRNTLKAYLDQNIYAFSGARSLSVLKLYNGFLTGEDGHLVSFERFKSKIADIDPILNVQHLQAEHQVTIASAQMADKWETLKKFPTLQYSTVGDGAVRPSHAALDGLVIETNDPLLNKIYPVKDFRCRCNMIPAAAGAAVTDREKIRQIANNLDTKPYFRHHVGKERIVFSDEHPYFQNYKGKISDLQAERNYSMRSIKQIYDLNDLPELNYLADKETANNWWHHMAGGDLRGSFDLKAQDGLTIKFDNNFRRHVMEDNTDDRFKFIHTLVDAVKAPDEIWSVRGKKALETRYIKYYDDFPVIVQVSDSSAATMFQANKDGKINIDTMRKQRQGQLKYKNENR